MPCSTSAQPGFNTAQSAGFTYTEFKDALVRNDTIVTYGDGQDSINNWAQGVVLAKFDSSGNLIKSKMIVHPPGDWYSVGKYWGKIVGTSDGGYAMTTATYYSKKGVLIKTDRDFNVEFIAEYPDTINLSNYFYKLLETKDGYLLYGAIQRPDYHDDGFLRYVDKTGSTIWFKYIQFSNFINIIQDIYPLTDSTFIFTTASLTTSSTSTFKHTTSFTTINRLGVILSSWTSEINPECGMITEIIDTLDGGIIAFGMHYNGSNGNTPLFQSTLSIFDNVYNQIENNHFGLIRSSVASAQLHKMYKLYDDNYIGIGESSIKEGSSPSRKVGWLYKFSTQGDSIWERKVNAPFLPLTFTNSGFFAGGGVLSSGNIIAAGTCNQGNTDYAWLLKVSSDGCIDTIFCQPSVVSDVFSRAGKITAYPNPSRGEFTVELPPLAENLAIFDAYGRLVHQQNIERGTLTINLQLNLHPGVYSVVVGGNGLHRAVRVVILK
jgi:hypothetical protein